MFKTKTYLFVVCVYVYASVYRHVWPQRHIWRPEFEGRMYFLVPLTSSIFRHLFNLEFTLSARQAGQCVMGICVCMFLHSSGSQPCTVPHWTIWQKHSLLGFVILNSLIPSFQNSYYFLFDSVSVSVSLSLSFVCVYKCLCVYTWCTRLNGFGCCHTI